MSAPGEAAELPAVTLLEIIRLQTEVARLGPDLGQVMALVTERVQRLTAAEGAILELAEGEDMVYRAAAGIAQDLLGLRLRRAGSLSGLCVGQNQILYCADAETDPRVDRAACRRVGLRSMVVTPLQYGGRAVGVLKIAAARPQAFGGSEARILGLISEMIAAEVWLAEQAGADQLYHRATHDGLTGLANRALFFDHLRQQMEGARRRGERLAVVNLDMDGLKPVNDRFGHRAGDAALAELARRIESETRAMDTAARVGGDEFAVLLARVEGRADAERHAARLAAAVRGPFAFEGQELALDASLGTALFPDDATAMAPLLEAADRAMYAVKRRRGGRGQPAQ